MALKKKSATNSPKKNDDQKFPNEKWKMLQFDVVATKERSVEVSNYGRVRSYSSPTNFNYLNGTDIKGYKIIKLKFFAPRTQEAEQVIQKHKAKVLLLEKKYLKLQNNKENNAAYRLSLKTSKKEIDDKKIAHKALLRTDEKKRTINYSKLNHRMVAEAFSKPKSPAQTIVIHLDHNKRNNHASNLKWVSQKMATEHQQKSPAVIKAKKERFGKRFINSKVYKLNVKKVATLKRKIKDGTSLSLLSKEYGITQTQLLRIKRGENWGDVAASK
jgi:LysM repeat protein